MKVLPYRMFCPVRNLGDAINPYLIKKISGAEPYFTGAEKHLLGVGSIFFLINKSSFVWGSGLLKPDHNLIEIPTSQFKAVRGELTRKYLLDHGHDVGHIPVGDPGYLMKKHYQQRKLEKKFKACVIPHYAFYDLDIFNKFRGREDICYFNMMTNNVDSLDKMLQSEVVISQSLHGLIFAEAFGIPSVWISSRFDDAWKFKFLDWYSTTYEPRTEPLPLDTSLDQLLANARMSHSSIDVEGLEQAFPKDELVMELDYDLVPYENCVEHNAVTLPLRFDYKLKDYRSLDDRDISSIGKLLREAYLEKAIGYSAPPYFLVGNGVENLSLSEIEKITKLMDVKSNFYFASVVRGVSPPKDETVHTINGLKVGKNNYLGDIFFVRPGRHVSLKNSFLTIYL